MNGYWVLLIKECALNYRGPLKSNWVLLIKECALNYRGPLKSMLYEWVLGSLN